MSFNEAKAAEAVAEAASPFGRMSLRTLYADMAGAGAATLIAIAAAMALGPLAFASLGPSYVAVGVVAALLCSVVGNLIGAAMPGARCQIMGARASATVVFAGVVAALAARSR